VKNKRLGSVQALDESQRTHRAGGGPNFCCSPGNEVAGIILSSESRVTHVFRLSELVFHLLEI